MPNHRFEPDQNPFDLERIPPRRRSFHFSADDDKPHKGRGGPERITIVEDDAPPPTKPLPKPTSEPSKG